MKPPAGSSADLSVVWTAPCASDTVVRAGAGWAVRGLAADPGHGARAVQVPVGGPGHGAAGGVGSS